jgi:hypothetical protein
VQDSVPTGRRPAQTRRFSATLSDFVFNDFTCKLTLFFFLIVLVIEINDGFVIELCFLHDVVYGYITSHLVSSSDVNYA